MCGVSPCVELICLYNVFLVCKLLRHSCIPIMYSYMIIIQSNLLVLDVLKGIIVQTIIHKHSKPPISPADLWLCIETAIEQAYDSQQHVILMGDINHDMPF